MRNFIFLSILSISFYSISCPSLLDEEVRALDSDQYLNLCDMQGKVILVVNVASRCGYTYQYDGLQKLYQNYKDEGLIVLGFPSRDFWQELRDESKVADFCSTTYGVTFPMLATTKVRGKNAHSFYHKLAKATGHYPSWNFNKYLIYRDGETVKRYKQGVDPDSGILLTDLKEALEKDSNLIN